VHGQRVRAAAGVEQRTLEVQPSEQTPPGLNVATRMHGSASRLSWKTDDGAHRNSAVSLTEIPQLSSRVVSGV